MTVTPEAIRAKVDERCQRLRTDKLDLLQFHWQFVSFNIPQACIPVIYHLLLYQTVQ